MSSNHTIKKSVFSSQLISKVLILYVFISISCFMFTSNTYAQTPSLAEKVFEKYQTFLQREDIKELFPVVLVEIKKPENQAFLVPETINLVVDNPDLLKTFVPDIDDDFITLLKEDQEIQAFLRDTDVQSLLQDINAIDELTELLRLAELTLAERVVEKFDAFFQRKDIMDLLPTILASLKKTEIQLLLTPELISSIVDNPDLLKAVLPNIDEEFITLLKDDAEVKEYIKDPDVQLLLQDPIAIDELAALINLQLLLPVIVKILPDSVESPRVGEQLIITVDIADGQDVYGYMADLNYDSTALRFVSLEHGSYLQGELLPLPTSVMDNKISFAQISIDMPAGISDGTLVTITFEVIEVKESELTLSEVIISKDAGVELPVIIENAEILEPPTKPWDANKDGNVNILDLTFVASHFGSDTAPPEADVNGDGRINILDLTLVASHFGE